MRVLQGVAKGLVVGFGAASYAVAVGHWVSPPCTSCATVALPPSTGVTLGAVMMVGVVAIRVTLMTALVMEIVAQNPGLEMVVTVMEKISQMVVT